MKLFLHPFHLDLKHTFKITHGTRNSLETLVVELQHEGESGFGEAAAIPYYGVTIDKMVRALERVRMMIESYSFGTPEDIWETMESHLTDNYFALCALDIAFHDLYGKLRKKPLYKIWNLELGDLPLSNYTIGIASVDETVEKLREKPWPVYKIKLGTKEDVAIVKALRQHTTAIFRVDANGAWNVEETLSNADHLKDLGVEFIEQPLAVDNWEGMKTVYKKSSLPCIADESCQKEADVEKCAGYFHGINIKLTKCGGLTPARRMIERGRKLGLKIMVGCMTESSVGISAIAQLLPLLDFVDMDGALLLKNDIADGVKIENGRVIYPERNGTGVVLK